jgi:hypothetical protein
MNAFRYRHGGRDARRTAAETAALQSKCYCLRKTFFASQRGATKTMDGIREKSWFIAFDEVSQPCQRKCGWDQQQGDHPMPPDNDHGRKTDRNRDHVQGTVDWMAMRAVVVRV